MAEKASKLRELTETELNDKIKELTEEQFNLRIRNSMQQLENPLRLRAVRRDIARCKTVLNAKAREQGA